MYEDMYNGNPKRRETDQNCQSLQGPKTRGNREQISISLQECVTYRAREELNEPVKKSQTFIDCIHRFLDCEFRNSVATVLKELLQKLQQLLRIKVGDNK